MNNITMPIAHAASALTNHTVMTSREIAELTGKDHRNVTRDIREMLEQLEKDVLSFEQMFPDTYGRQQPGFQLPKDLTITLVSGYSIPMRHAIVTRWQELEMLATQMQPLAPTIPNFGNPAEAARAWAVQYELAESSKAQVLLIQAAKAQADQKLAIAVPKVDVYDAVVADQLMTIPAFGMLLEGVNTQSMHKDLVRMGYLRKTPKGFGVPSQYRDTLFKVSICPIYGRTVVRVLSKGQQELTRLWMAGMLTMKASHRAVTAPTPTQTPH